MNEIRGVIPILTDREGATWLSTESRIFTADIWMHSSSTTGITAAFLKIRGHSWPTRQAAYGPVRSTES
ncbi:MAG: hypothetical protein MZV63_37710 [Marinilabiliales bacterium]|nr:hypothetical protein [Marinilabiliales bacterium]